MYFTSYHEQVATNGIVLVGAVSQIFPFGESGNAFFFGNGKIYYRIARSDYPTSNLQSIISANFAIRNFEPRQVVIVSYDEVPPYNSGVFNIVSH